MTLDDQLIVSRFESAAYGGLVRVLSIAARSFSVDIAAGRLFGVHPSVQLVSHMDLGSVRFPPQRAEELYAWPMHRDSVFGIVGEKRMNDTAFRPKQFFDHATFARTDQFRPMEPYARVVDAFCLTMPLVGQAWAMLLFVRCAPHRPFEDSVTELMERTRPAMARVMREGYQRDVHAADDPHRGALPMSAARVSSHPVSHGAVPPAPVHMTSAPTPPPISADSFSQTELQVLAMLVEGLTEKQIAERMGRSPHTTHVHVRNIYRKTGITSRSELKRACAGLNIAPATTK